MKLRELTLTENPGQVPNPAQQPAQGASSQQQQKTAQGAKVAGSALGAKGGSGAMMAKGLDKVAQGGALPANLAKQIAPFAKNLETILGDTTMRQKFMMLIKQAEKGAAQQQVATESKKVEMCPKACCGKPVTECKCGPDCEHCDCYEKNKAMKEDATAGATSAGNIASVANPVMAHGKRGKDSKGLPKAPQKKNKDGTAKNALDINNGLMGGKTIKR